MTKREKIYDLIKNLEDYMILNLWGNYCESVNDPDSEIYFMDDFDEYAGYYIDANGAYNFSQRIYYGDFNPNDSYWCWSAYGNLKSFSDFEDDKCPIDFSALVEYLIDGGEWDYELDEDDLKTAFQEEYCNCEKFDEVVEENGFDFLTDDWEEIWHAIVEAEKD